MMKVKPTEVAEISPRKVEVLLLPEVGRLQEEQVWTVKSAVGFGCFRVKRCHRRPLRKC